VGFMHTLAVSKAAQRRGWAIGNRLQKIMRIYSNFIRADARHCVNTPLLVAV